jgi:hypothetical protein
MLLGPWPGSEGTHFAHSSRGKLKYPTPAEQKARLNRRAFCIL